MVKQAVHILDFECRWSIVVFRLMMIEIDEQTGRWLIVILEIEKFGFDFEDLMMFGV